MDIKELYELAAQIKEAEHAYSEALINRTAAESSAWLDTDWEEKGKPIASAKTTMVKYMVAEERATVYATQAQLAYLERIYDISFEEYTKQGNPDGNSFETEENDIEQKGDD